MSVYRVSVFSSLEYSRKVEPVLTKHPLCRLVEGFSLRNWQKVFLHPLSLADNEVEVKRIAVQLLEVRLGVGWKACLGLL